MTNPDAEARPGLLERDVVCPYCAETVHLLLESDVHGEMVYDCEICCRPWRLRVQSAREGARVEVAALDD